ncbi:hypothetical protein TNCV_2250101 [Trichonephila clavipes]|nr:hypothetical protein TNCV_2250101 [Trichonephila clavipes]
MSRLQFLFMDDNAPCHLHSSCQTALTEWLDIERMDVGSVLTSKQPFSEEKGDDLWISIPSSMYWVFFCTVKAIVLFIVHVVNRRSFSWHIIQLVPFVPLVTIRETNFLPSAEVWHRLALQDEWAAMHGLVNQHVQKIAQLIDKTLCYIELFSEKISSLHYDYGLIDNM